MTEFEWDTRCADLELARLEAGFTGYDHTNFARVLLDGALRVRGDIHVVSGRLRSSTSASVDTSSSSRWEGEINVGGPGIPYAASEFFGYAAKYGGWPSHQYMKYVGWLPTPRGAFDHLGRVAWSQNPVGSIPTSRGIDDDMIGPVSSFISRGRRTPHPEGHIR